MKWTPSLSLAVAAFALASCDPYPVTDAPNRFDPRSNASQVGMDATGAPQFSSYKVPGRISNSMLRPRGTAYRLGVGDRLDIELIDKPETKQETQVLPDGMVYFDLAEGIPAEGRTVDELTQAITAKLKALGERQPLVRVTLMDITSRNYFILGQVNTPGIYPLNRPLTVLDAISEAGGLAKVLSQDVESLPDLEGSYLVRNHQLIPVNFERLIEDGDMSQNVYLEPDDYIFVPSTQDAMIYVLGAVKDPKAVAYKSGTTLVSALARAGGPTEKAFREKTVILRGTLTKPEYAIVNFKHILKGQGTNFALRPGDVVWVPNSPWEKIEEYLVQVVSAAAQAVAVYQGGRVIDPGSSRPTTIGIQ